MPTKVSNIGIKKQSNYRRKKNSKKRNILRTLGLAIFTIIISSIVITGISIYKFLNAPFSSASLQGESMPKDGVWGKDDLNLIVIRVDDKHKKDRQVNAFMLANFDLINKRYNFFEFPLDEEFIYIDETKGSLRNLGSKNMDFIANSFFKQFAVKPDGYILMDNQDYKSFEDLLGQGIPFKDLSAVLRVKNTFKMPTLISQFRERAETNLTLSDVLGILKFIKNTSETSSSIKEISLYGILDPDVWDQVWNNNLSYENIKKEHVKVLILNGSTDPKIPGLAGWGARVVKNIGSTVLDTENSFEIFSQTTLIAANKNSKTVKELASIFNIPYIVDIKDLDQNKNYNPQIFRSDITLVVVNYAGTE